MCHLNMLQIFDLVTRSRWISLERHASWTPDVLPSPRVSFQAVGDVASDCRQKLESVARISGCEDEVITISCMRSYQKVLIGRVSTPAVSGKQEWSSRKPRYQVIHKLLDISQGFSWNAILRMIGKVPRHRVLTAFILFRHALVSLCRIADLDQTSLWVWFEEEP